MMSRKVVQKLVQEIGIEVYELLLIRNAPLCQTVDGMGRKYNDIRKYTNLSETKYLVS